MAKRRIVKDQDGNKWEVREGIASSGSAPFRVPVWNGAEWEEREVVGSKGQPYTVTRWIQPKSERNRQRGRQIVPRHLLDSLEKQKYIGKITVEGRRLLALERLRGGCSRKAPAWWIVEQAEKLQNAGYNPLQTK